jgi:hypothetical protein
MNSAYTGREIPDSPNWLAATGRGALRLTWHTIRLPALALLVTMEPLVCGLLSLLAMLGVLTALFWEFVVKPPHFPFWIVLGVSVGFALLQVPYYLLIRLFSAR